MDKEKEQEKIKKCIGENFKTNTGKRIAYNRFILDQQQIITVMYFTQVSDLGFMQSERSVAWP